MHNNASNARPLGSLRVKLLWQSPAPTKEVNLPNPNLGMNITQLITMLMAAEAQGAKYAMLARVDDEGHGHETGIEWVAPHPVGGYVYLATFQKWETLSNEGRNSVEI